MIASSAMLLAVPAAQDGMMQGKGMGQGGQKMMQGKQMKKKQMMKKRMNSPFLIRHGLPHMTKMVMPYLDDPVFALTADQKDKLSKVRSDTMGAIKEIRPEVISLRKEIVNASTSGKSALEIKDKVENLALLEAKATMAQLKCIEETTNILTKDQLLFLLSNKNKSMKHGKKTKGHGRGRMNRNQ